MPNDTDLNEPDFEFEFYSKVPDPDDKLKLEAENRLRKLAKDHSDLIGASVILSEIVEGATTPYLFQAKIVAYTRPNYIAVEEKGSHPVGVLKAALSVIERQVREKREKLRTKWKQP